MDSKRNILLTPGPATTTETVKMAQIVPDICPRENEFTELITKINESLINIVTKKPSNYACTLFGGSGTAVVESMLSSVVCQDSYVLIINNGAYGKRMVEIAEIHDLNFIEYKCSGREKINIKDIKQNILEDNKITHLAVVHHETTTGILNSIEKVGALARQYNIELLVDGISSYGAIGIDMDKIGISHLVATSNKNLQGMAGVGFIISSKSSLSKLDSKNRKTLYLDLSSQYKYLLNKGQFHFTPPVQTLYALNQAINELKLETVNGRYKRYSKSWKILVDGMDKLGFRQFVPLINQSRLICTFFEPQNFNYNNYHNYLLERGITIYPGKIENQNTFRIGLIGDIDTDDIQLLLNYTKSYIEKNQ